MADSQLKPGLTPPEKCPQGCARWENLAADGNTANQNDVNAKWKGGSPPKDAGSLCAQPSNDSKMSAWCYCAGTKDDSWGYCQDRNASASVCKSTPNELNSLNTQIGKCTSNIEYTRNTNFAENTFKLQKDIETLSSTVMDTLNMGDTMFGQYGYKDIAKQVKDRNEELTNKRDTLYTAIDKNEAIIERSNRDFSDVKDKLPQPQPKRVLRFIEDYTLAILSIAYLFMIISIIYVYTMTSEFKLIGFGKAIVSSILITIFLFMILFYLV